MSADRSYLFQWPDYLLFVLSLASTLIVGLFFAIKDKWTSEKSEDYLMAGRRMNWFLVAQSVFASATSSTLIVGLSAEFYYMGIVYIWASAGLFLAAGFTSIVIVAKFFRLRFQVTSAYEYLEYRFNLAVRMLVGLIYVVFTILFMAVVLYVPSLVLSQVTGLDIRLSISIGAVVCLIYTSLGGMKAVIWVDNIQVLIIISGLITVLVKGMHDVGGFDKAWSIYQKGKRTAWNDIDVYPWDRHTIWNCIFLTAISVSGYTSTHQMLIQRYLTVPSMKMAQISVIVGLAMVAALAFCMALVGVAAFALLGGNEPLLTGMTSRPDGIFPLYVMEVIGHIPGIPGLVISALYAASLSCLSSGQNALAAVFLEDLLTPIYKLKTSRQMTDRSRAIVCKTAAAVAGLLTLGLTLTVPYFSDYVYSLTRSAESFISGPLFGVFICGLFLGYVESWGVFVGCLSSIIFGFQQYIGWLTKHHKHLGNDQPPLYLKNFTVELTVPTPDVKPNIYDTSYQWYVLIDTLIVIIVASIISPMVHLYRHRGRFQLSAVLPSPELRYTLKDFKSAFGWKENDESTKIDVELNTNGASEKAVDANEDMAEDGEVIENLLTVTSKVT